METLLKVARFLFYFGNVDIESEIHLEKQPWKRSEMTM
jgi:hypothetical protein